MNTEPRSLNDNWRWYPDGSGVCIERRLTRTRKSDDKAGRWLKGDKYDGWEPHYFSCLKNALTYAVQREGALAESTEQIIPQMQKIVDDIERMLS